MGERNQKRCEDKRKIATDMFLSGATQEHIANRMGCTRQYVSFILRGDGITGNMGGAYLRTALKRERENEIRNRRFIELYGLPEREFNNPKTIKLYKAFAQQRNSAQQRGIAWNLKFSEWIDVWNESGKLQFRGRGKKMFCMARVGDSGAYKKGNVYICTNFQNWKDLWRNKPDMAIRLLLGKKQRFSNRTHCSNGHERETFGRLSPDGKFVCRKCNNIACKKYYEKNA